MLVNCISENSTFWIMLGVSALLLLQKNNISYIYHPMQMLSMRNGLYLDPNYLSGALQHLHHSQMLTRVSVTQATNTSTGLDVPPVNPDSAAPQMFDQINSAMHPRQPLVGPSVPNYGNSHEQLFPAETSQHFPEVKLLKWYWYHSIPNIPLVC
jgi:hypothetical protein